jgi:hypothetical protein
VGLLGQLSTVALPVGSSRRARAVGIARRLGLHSGGANGDYQRWVAAVEHRTFSPWPESDTDVAARIDRLHFIVTVNVEPSTTPRWLERTVVAMQGQSHSNWRGVIRGATPAHCGQVLDRLLAAEARLESGSTAIQVDGSQDGFEIEITAGDVLSPHALFEVARTVAIGGSSIALVTADFDTVSFGGDNWVSPVRSPGPGPEASLQFDLLSGFVARRPGTSPAEARSLVGELSVAASAPKVQHLSMVLLHRAAKPGPRVVQLANANPELMGEALSAQSIRVGPAQPQFGTRVQHRVQEPCRVGIIVREPLHGIPGDHQRHDLNRLIAMAGHESVFPDDPPVTVAIAGFEVSGAVEISGLGQRCVDEGFDAIMILDGSLRLTDPGVFRDLLGVLQRDGVLAVAPMVTTPSSMVVDAGLLRPSGVWVPRCGSLQRLPFELQTTRSVDAFSGRVCLLRVADLESFARVGLTPHGFASVAAASNRRLVVWPHQRAVVEYGFDSASGAAPAVTPWLSGRIAQWFGPGINGYRPLNDSRTESVW